MKRFTMSDAECGPGWKHLIEPILARAQLHGVQVVQVKEKFGGLRIYWDPPMVGNEAEPGVLDIFGKDVEAAERMSWLVCEKCGQPGMVRDLPWIKVWCPSHYTEYLSHANTNI